MNRCALTIAAGPTYSGCAQKLGHELVQAAQRMHLVVSSYTSRCSWDCRRSPVPSGSSATRNGRTERYLPKNSSMSTTRSFTTGRPGSGATLMLFPSCSTRTLQARRLRPLIKSASEPQTPWAHERRKVMLPSSNSFARVSTSSTRSIGSTGTRYVSQ